MLGYDYFYAGITEKVITVFEYAFKDTYIQKPNATGTYDRIKVIPRFANKNYTEQARKLEANANSEIMYPTMLYSLKLDGVDDTKLTSKYINTNIPDAAGNDRKFKNPIPIKYSCVLKIVSNDIRHVLQLYEQIIPCFHLGITIKVKPFPEYDGNINVDMKIESITEDFEQGESYREFIIEITFAISTVLFAPPVAKDVITDISKTGILTYILDGNLTLDNATHWGTGDYYGD